MKKVREFLVFLIDIAKPAISILNLITQNKNQNIYLDASNVSGYVIFKFLPTSEFKWIDPKEFDLNKYTSSSSERCVLEVDLEYPKELRELHNEYPLTPDKIEIKRKMFCDCQLKIADLYNIPNGNVKK